MNGEEYIIMTFAAAKRPRRDAARNTGVLFRLFFTRNFYFIPRRRPHTGPGMHDFLRLFMEMREVCESVSRDSKERKVVKRREEWGKGGKFSRGSRVK